MPDFHIKNFDPRNPPSGESDNSWERIIKGQTIGKRVVLPIQHIGEGADVPSPVNVLSIQSIDDNACQLNLTLSPPRYIAGSPALFAIPNIQDATGEADNQSPGFDATVATSLIGDVFARIEWGIGGVSDTVDVDFVNGLCINLVASFCRLQVLVNFKNLDRAVVLDAAYVLSAFVGPGFPKARNAQRTIILGKADNKGTFQALNEESVVFQVPKYAKAVTLVGAQVDNAVGTIGLNNPFTGKIVFLRGPTKTQPYMISEENFTEDSHDPVNVPNSALFFYFRNTTPTPPAANSTVRAVAIFDLAV